MVQHDSRRQSLKVATGELIDAAGGQARAAEYSRRIKRQQSFSDYALVNVDTFIPVDAALDLEARTVGLPGWPHVTREMCARNGGSFVANVVLPGSTEAHLRLAELIKEFSDVSTAMAVALADGKLCAEDVRRGALVAEADQLVSKAAEVRALLERIEAEG
ncbi:hypothetical protein WP12_16810 [Sphingomonas sp. SRS2]|nr:hypothetical protein WP12_16810 [Sphingomonas sp. SRS2]